MDQTFGIKPEQAAAFQKLWTDSAAKFFETALTASPNSPPPELIKQIRSGIFAALAQSWDEFMRSPQFLEATKQWLDTAISFRKMSNDFMARIRTDLQAPSRDDIDTVMLNIRHMEKRLLDRLDDLAVEMKTLKQQTHARARRQTGKKPGKAGPKTPRAKGITK